MNKKELLSELIETERAKLNRLIEEASAGAFPEVGDSGRKFSKERGFPRLGEAVYHQSRYLDRLIEQYMECA